MYLKHEINLHLEDFVMLNAMYCVFTAAAIVVPCLSTLVSDHGEPFIHSYL